MVMKRYSTFLGAPELFVLFNVNIRLFQLKIYLLTIICFQVINYYCYNLFVVPPWLSPLFTIFSLQLKKKRMFTENICTTNTIFMNRLNSVKHFTWEFKKKYNCKFGPVDLGSIPGRVISKTLLDTTLLNTQQYKVCIEGKVEQSRERCSALSYTSV